MMSRMITYYSVVSVISLDFFIGCHSTAILTPSVVRVCPLSSDQSYSFICETDTGGMLWIENAKFVTYDISSTVGQNMTVGNFTTRLDSVEGNNYTSTATVDLLSLSLPSNNVNTILTIRCDDTGDAKGGKNSTLTINALPMVPTVTVIPFIQTSSNSSSLLISWSMSDCAVQYVVTIINSSDGSVYLNITTSDTNTTVTLPTGVEYCVTVLGVDSIGRTGPPSTSKCYTLVLPAMTTALMSTSRTAAVSTNAGMPSSTPSVDPPPSGVSGGVIAGVVIVIILAVIAAVTVLVIIVYWKRHKKQTESPSTPLPALEYRCVCQMFCKEEDESIKNSWKVIFAFVSSKSDLQAVKTFYETTKFKEYGSESINCCLKSSCTTIKVKIRDKTDGWEIVKPSKLQICKAAAVKAYSSEGEPPTVEMTFRPVNDKITPHDLTVTAEISPTPSVDGAKKPITTKFEKEAQNVVECVCQVFYHKIALNHWRARVALFPKQYLKKVNQLYQDANNCEPFDISFGGGVIKVSIDETVPAAAGWKVTIDKQYQLVTTAAVEQYTGEGEPPYCEMTLRAVNASTEMTTLFELRVTLVGVRTQPRNTFCVSRALEKSDSFRFSSAQNNLISLLVCQVIYHKLEGNNHWKVTLAFFTENKMDRVKQLYQDANLGQTIKNVKFSKFHNGAVGTIDVIKPDILTVANGWNMTHHEFIWIKRKTIVEYNGVNKPPCCVMIFKAGPEVSTPPDLTATITIGEPDKPTSTFTISRVAETSCEVAIDIIDSKPTDAHSSVLCRMDVRCCTQCTFST